MNIPDDYQCAIIKDDATEIEKYTALMSRLSNLSVAAMDGPLKESTILLLAGKDKWFSVIAEAFLMLHKGEDYESFLKKAAESN